MGHESNGDGVDAAGSSKDRYEVALRNPKEAEAGVLMNCLEERAVVERHWTVSIEKT